MTITEQLEQAGVLLSEYVGYLYESRDQAGTWRVEDARVARVCIEPTKSALGFEKEKHYDPERSLALQWVREGKLELCIVSVSDDMDINQVVDGGLMMESDSKRVCIGQTPDFMDNVYSVLRILEHMSRKDTSH